MKKDRNWLIMKVMALLIALAGVFWARSQLEQVAQPKVSVPDTIPAKVEFGK